APGGGAILPAASMRVSWRRPAAVWPSCAMEPARLRPRRVKGERGGGWGPVGSPGGGAWGLASGKSECSPGLATAHPLAGAITEPLGVSDRELSPQRVDEHAAG